MSESATTPTSDTAPETHSGGHGKHQAACEWCGDSFLASRRWSRFCGTPCRNAFHKATAPAAVKEARELVRLALEGPLDAAAIARGRKLLGIR